MTITVSLPGVTGASTESVTTPVADKTNLILVSSDQSDKTGRVVAVYTLSGADPGYPITLVVQADPILRGQKERLVSFTFNGWIKRASSVTDITEYWPLKASFNVVFPAEAPLVTADLDALMGVVYSYTYLSVSSGTRNTTWLAKLLAGSPQVK
jgi:hypothetical protein